jgi:hypothetical protein
MASSSSMNFLVWYRPSSVSTFTVHHKIHDPEGYTKHAFAWGLRSKDAVGQRLNLRGGAVANVLGSHCIYTTQLTTSLFEANAG